MAVILFSRTQLADQTPFDNTGNGFVATDVQEAIVEARATALSTRYVITAGYAGNANSNTFLQFFRSNPSDSTPFVIADASQIKSLSLATDTSTTATVSIYKNGTSTVIATISLVSALRSVVTGLSISLASSDYLVGRVTSGSIHNPGLYIFMQTPVV
jgi:hypothetical protein